jgi:hypothetical protein
MYEFPNARDHYDLHYELVYLRKLSLYILYLAKINGTLRSVLERLLFDVGDDDVDELEDVLDGYIYTSSDTMIAVGMYKDLNLLRQSVRELQSLDEAARIAVCSKFRKNSSIKSTLSRLAVHLQHKVDPPEERAPVRNDRIQFPIWEDTEEVRKMFESI